MKRLNDALLHNEFFAAAVLPFTEDPKRNLLFFNWQNNEFIDEYGNVFFVAPFSEKRKTNSVVVDQNQHLEIVQRAIDHIQKGSIQKVVISRIKEVEREGVDLFGTFQNLVQAYPQTFVYLVNHPEWGMWLGATPERLVVYNDAKWHTVALAGTQINTGPDLIWGEKEKNEQAVVAEFIVEELMAAGARHIEEEGPYTVAAGPVAHLKTDIRFTGNFDLPVIIGFLHPTPAVCGIPREKSLDFIHSNEPHDRELYSGPIGIKAADGKHKVYVNLRCMKITNIKLQLFLGGGIMHNSQAIAEWDETENKSKTLLSQLAR